MIKIFLIDINENDKDTFVSSNSLVEFPAHQKSFYAFSKTHEYFFNNEKKMITGVMINVNKPIYRHDKEIGEHYVVFTPKAAERMFLNMKKNGATNMVNIEHSDRFIKGIYEVEAWIVDRENGKGVPKQLERQDIEDGSIMVSYKIEDEEIFNKIKKGAFNGFSIEGVFYKTPLKIKKSNDLKKIASDLKKLL